MNDDGYGLTSVDYERFFELGLGLFCVAGPDGRFRHLNTSWSELLGFSREELCSRPFIDFVHPDDRERTLEETRRLVEGNETLAFENRYQCRDGSYRWILWKSKFWDGQIYGIARDISAKKRMELKLRLAQTQLQQVVALEKEARRIAEEQKVRLYELFSQVPALTAIFDGPEHVVRFANAAYRNLFGGRDLVGKRAQDFIQTSDSRIVKILDRVYDTGECFVGRKLEISADWNDDGQVTNRYFNLICEPARNDSGATDGIWFLAFDVTEENILKKRLEASEKMASLGIIAAGVGHEINNPLSFVNGNLEMVARELDQDLRSETKERNLKLQALVSDARLGIGRIVEITRSLKMFSHTGENAAIRTVVDIRSAIEGALRFSQSQIRHCAQVVLEIEGEPRVLGYEGQLSQVFLNLLVNAAQAIGPGNVNANEIRVRIELTPDRLGKITIADTGHGMSPETLEQIFNPFFTTREAGVGTGLGLMISNEIITSFGGKIQVTSEPGKGSTFTILLPHHELEMKDEVSEVSQLAMKRSRILIVDDEPLLVSMIRDFLGEENDVRVAYSGVEALAVLQDSPEFDTILCDLMMPHMTGMELHAAISSLKSGLERKIIFMTGGAFTPEARDFLTHCSNHVIEKPFTSQELISMILNAQKSQARAG